VIYRKCNNISLFDWCINLYLSYSSYATIYFGHYFSVCDKCRELYAVLFNPANKSNLRNDSGITIVSNLKSNSGRVIELLTSSYRYKKAQRISYSSFVLVSRRAAPWLSLFATYRFYERFVSRANLWYDKLTQ